MKRRNFVQSLLVAPVAPAVIEAGQAPTAPTQRQPTLQPVRQGPQNVATLKLTDADLTAETAPHFFTATQFSTLKKLGSLFMPPLKSNPGALEAKAPEFLDFLIGASPADRQELYRSGLDNLEKQAQDKFHKSFNDLDAQQTDSIIRPLLVARHWAEDFPDDPLKHFIAQVHEDLRTATMNSREWAEASEKTGTRFSRGFRGSGYYWFPIDPISEG